MKSIKKTKITAKEQKKIEIISVFPDEVDILPWAGHFGGKNGGIVRLYKR